MVDACEESRRRLNVDQIDLNQLHIPGIVQPFCFLRYGSPKDEVHWDSLAESYHRDLVKNDGLTL